MDNLDVSPAGPQLAAPAQPPRDVTPRDQFVQEPQQHLGMLQTSPAALLVMGGWTMKDRTDSAVALPLAGGGWRATSPLPAPRALAAAAVLHGRVYLVGGEDGRSPATDSVAVLDVAADSWAAGPRTCTARSRLAAAALGGRLYAAGGCAGNGSDAFDSVEALDPREGVWRPVAPMAARRRELGVAALVGSLYAVGGCDGYESLNSTERYDPTADRWEAVEAMAERRSGLGVGVVDGALYAVGGQSDAGWLRSVERWSAGAGWRAAPPLAAPRDNAVVTAHGGLLYAMAGIDQGLRINSTVAFDPATGAWSELPALPASRECAAAVVIPWLTS